MDVVAAGTSEGRDDSSASVDSSESSLHKSSKDTHFFKEIQALASTMDGTWRPYSSGSACRRGARWEIIQDKPTLYTDTEGSTAAQIGDCRIACRNVGWCRCITMRQWGCVGPDWNKNLGWCWSGECELSSAIEVESTITGDDYANVFLPPSVKGAICADATTSGDHSV